MCPSRPISILLLLLVAAPLSAAEDTDRYPVELCIKAKGLDPEALESTRERARGDLEELDARVLPGPQGGTAAVDCKEGAFLRAAHERGARGVIDIHVLRFGPLVRITMRVFYPGTGKEVLHVKAKAKSKNFPVNTSIEAILQRGLDNLRASHRALTDKKRVARTAKTGSEDGKQPGDRKQGKGGGQRTVAAKADIEEVPPLAPEFMVLETTAPPRDDTWYWIGGGILAGGLALSGAGVYVLAGPFRDMLDRRDQTHQEYQRDGLDDQTYIDLRKKYMDQDDQAARLHVTGWVLAGVGAAMTVGGLIVMLVETQSGPGESPEESRPGDGTSFKPVLAPHGGGLVWQWTW